ncbi:CIA30 family protein [Aspergillus candidus]|uniref:CIA30-domain-containing protein n=1 Tax=Aspergillus candidus TaxID=41067 RepID=A0A2I2F419_ASPCN|nr:CIA30-domain-containing protein [Aspergillus candidus]PLB35328.1 CIA30-domain-containing protein [Aspergillus candidus]
MEYANNKKLFSSPWDLQEWAASDDRVRGGHSTSCLSRTPHGVLFHGNLDIKALGGAGFASQKTVSTEKTWDLSDYDGLELDVHACDSKRYTVAVTDEIPERRPDGREQSALIWEVDFCPKEMEKVVRVKWSELRPTYRGKEVPVARPLDLSRVRRFRIMIRSFFGAQEGAFQLEVRSIGVFRALYQDEEDTEYIDEKSWATEEGEDGLLCGCCGIV